MPRSARFPEPLPKFSSRLQSWFIETFADVHSYSELVSIKNCLTTAQAESKMAQEQLALLQQRRDTLENSLRRGFNGVEKSWKEKVKA